MALVLAAYLEAANGEPCLKRDWLAEHTDGLILLTGGQ